jgi:GTP:adenosylcobinamide-phosphate guanylyltransferase
MPEEFPVDVIVLAGDRGSDDPLASRAGVAGKTLVKVAGRPMLLRVVDTLSAWPCLGRMIVVAPNTEAHAAALDSVDFDPEKMIRLAPQSSPSQSVAFALEACRRDRPVLLVTADHPLLNASWLDRMLQTDPGADLTVGLVDYQSVTERFPGSRRTRYRFRDVSICGTNLFVFKTIRADAVVHLWRRIEQQRKRPWRIVSILGWSMLGRYLAGRLSLADAMSALSERTGATISACMLDDPLSAVDVDTPDDLELVEQVIGSRTASCS